MIYRICRVTNITLCFLFIILAFYPPVFLNDFSATSLIMSGIIFFTYAILLWFNFICSKLDRHNKEKIIISKRLKNTGIVIFVLVLLLITGIFISAVAAYISFFENDGESNKFQRISFTIVMCLFFLSALTAIFNLISFTRSIKNNKLVVNEFINDIGTQA